ncbi:MAG: acyl-CoA thioesterase [Flavobacteriaceae bacterium]
MFLKEFEIRWNDLDANRHLGNIAYLSYAGDTRMAFLRKVGLTNQKLQELGVGPIVFDEHMYYFKEVLPDETLRVSLEVSGLSIDGTFFEFIHNFYNKKGINVARCEMLGGWMSLVTRKLTPLPEDLINNFKTDYKTLNFKTLQVGDTRKRNQKPKNLTI